MAPAVKARPVLPVDPPTLVADRPARWQRPSRLDHPGIRHNDPTASEAIGKLGGRRPKTSPSRFTYPTSTRGHAR